jgi:hypothetical protein
VNKASQDSFLYGRGNLSMLGTCLSVLEQKVNDFCGVKTVWGMLNISGAKASVRVNAKGG